jgi:hypothetical protein
MISINWLPLAMAIGAAAALIAVWIADRLFPREHHKRQGFRPSRPPQ